MPTTEPTHEGQPLLDGFIEHRFTGMTHANLLRVWCRWCCRWHEHGLADGKPGEITHRSAHCFAMDHSYDSYYVRITDTPFSRVRNSLTVSSVAQSRAIRRGVISPAVQRLRNQPRPVGDFPKVAR